MVKTGSDVAIKIEINYPMTNYHKLIYQKKKNYHKLK